MKSWLPLHEALLGTVVRTTLSFSLPFFLLYPANFKKSFCSCKLLFVLQVDCLPNPIDAARRRIPVLCKTLSQTFDISNPETANGFLLAFVTKMIDALRCEGLGMFFAFRLTSSSWQVTSAPIYLFFIFWKVPGSNIEEEHRFLAFTRVYSGRIREGDRIFVWTHDHKKRACQVARLFLPMGPSLIPVQEVG